MSLYLKIHYNRGSITFYGNTHFYNHKPTLILPNPLYSIQSFTKHLYVPPKCIPRGLNVNKEKNSLKKHRESVFTITHHTNPSQYSIQSFTKHLITYTSHLNAFQAPRSVAPQAQVHREGVMLLSQRVLAYTDQGEGGLAWLNITEAIRLT